MMKGKPAKIGIQIAAIVVLMIVTTGVAPGANSEDRPKGLASVLIEGASANARYVVDGSPVSVKIDSESTRLLVIKAGKHVIEVQVIKDVVFRKEVVLDAGETRALKVAGAPSE